ncbi:hypothetical protein EXIGLDRAFT_697405 [Exidia glandulosa HHB12029]|uniref:Uncharacterized protein n=1 Tax=Exidia glandulosa HHB12029 TaxID=1314781 RepID=A0A165MXR4_EXIGL|nr:hypothetical protein EXIGLDRAFT_697405 [Exidia glandulosa HHB12029]
MASTVYLWFATFRDTGDHDPPMIGVNPKYGASRTQGKLGHQKPSYMHSVTAKMSLRRGGNTSIREYYGPSTGHSTEHAEQTLNLQIRGRPSLYIRLVSRRSRWHVTEHAAWSVTSRLNKTTYERRLHRRRKSKIAEKYQGFAVKPKGARRCRRTRRFSINLMETTSNLKASAIVADELTPRLSMDVSKSELEAMNLSTSPGIAFIATNYPRTITDPHTFQGIESRDW